jgi:hypothetical protein
MRNTLLYAAALSGLLLFNSGCKKETTLGVSKVVDVSFPSIELKGDPAVLVAKGGTYTDAGAILTDDISGAKSDIQPTENPVNTAEEGLYTVTYTAANSTGFETTVQRHVLVMDYTPPGGLDPNIDLSGTYVRTANGAENHVYKVATGLYVMDNVGGVLPPSAAVLPVYMMMTSDSTISIPEQPVPNGYESLDATDETVDLGPPITLKYRVVNPGFGTSIRTFVKQ